MWMIYSERFVDNKAVRWFYGTYADRDRANELALQLKDQYRDPNLWFCVIPAEDAEAYGVRGV